MSKTQMILDEHKGEMAETHAAAALAEAERVLAGVEPSDVGMHVRTPYLSHNERAALAEGLAFAITAIDVMIGETQCIALSK